MIFACKGRTYDTSSLHAYRTGNPAMPTVYVSPDGEEVFVVTVDRWTGVAVRPASAEEAGGLAERLGIAELKPASPSSCRSCQ